MLVASGDLFYEWDLRADSLAWTGMTADAIGVADAAAIASGDAFLKRIHPEDLPHRMIALSRHFEKGEVFDRELRVRADNGQFHWVRERAVAALSPAGEPLRLTGVVRNINARKRSEDVVSYLTNHGALTGHYNRERLREELEQTVGIASRRNRQGALLPPGLDKLAVVSDVYGPETADPVGLSAARRIAGRSG